MNYSVIIFLVLVYYSLFLVKKSSKQLFQKVVYVELFLNCPKSDCKLLLELLTQILF